MSKDFLNSTQKARNVNKNLLTSWTSSKLKISDRGQDEGKPRKPKLCKLKVRLSLFKSLMLYFVNCDFEH